MASDLYNQIVSQRGTLESLVARIPGFRGYQESTARRTADTMLRDYIATQIQQRIDRLVRIEKLILDTLGTASLSRTRDVKGNIQLFHDKVKTAAPGYAGMWAQMKIGPEELEKLYAFDEAQIVYVDKIDLALDRLQEAVMNREGVEAAIFNLGEVVAEAIAAFDLRDDVLTDLSSRI